MFEKTANSISSLNSFRMAVTTSNYSNLFTLSAGGFADYIVMVGKATFSGTPGVCWIGLNSTTNTAKMDALLFNGSFLSNYGSTYTPKFARYYTGKTMYLLMDSDSAGLPLLV